LTSPAAAPRLALTTAPAAPARSRHAGLIAGRVVDGVGLIGSAIAGLRTSPAATIGSGHLQ